ncbi:MAG: hypothetical protein WCP87_02340, partial [Atribacterota bacterium]
SYSSLPGIAVITNRSWTSDFDIPLYSVQGRVIGQVISTRIHGLEYELIYVHGHLIGIGEGEYLKTVFLESEKMFRSTLQSRYGEKVEAIHRRLIFINPLSFIINGTYTYEGKVINDLNLHCNSFIMSLFPWDDFSGELHFETQSSSFRGVSFHEVTFPLPSYEYYLSDFSTCLLMLADYWRSKDWIRMPLPPDDSRYFLVNLHLMIQDVDRLRRKCNCEKDSKSTSEIIRLFIQARGKNVGIQIGEKNIPDGSESFSFEDIKRIIQDEDQPYLMEISSFGKFVNYGIVNGYLEIPDGEYVECVFPVALRGERRWQRYFFKWDEGYDSFKIYQITGRAGE